MTKDQAIKHFGSGAKVADALKITRQAVSNWVDVPLLQQVRLQKITRGKLKAEI